MTLHTRFGLALMLVVISASAFAQVSVRTQKIKPPTAPADPPQAIQEVNRPTGQLMPLAGIPAEIGTDLSRLPAAVAGTRERILAAARSGDLNRVVALMQASGAKAAFTFTNNRDPAAFWKTSYPDSKGIEVLAILVSILETGYVRVDADTPQETYVWPYFVRMPLKSLSPAQKVELFRIVTGADYKNMVDFGAYAFYRLGIGRDGTWHFFVAGDRQN